MVETFIGNTGCTGINVHVGNTGDIERELLEIELLKTASPDELYTLLSSDPSFYLPLIKKYNHTGNLEHLFRCIMGRTSGGTLTIKFKIYPNDRWTEIGFFEYGSDREIYDEFSKHVTLLLKRSVSSIEIDKTAHVKFQTDAENDVKAHFNLGMASEGKNSEMESASSMFEFGQDEAKEVIKKVRKFDAKKTTVKSDSATPNAVGSSGGDYLAFKRVMKSVSYFVNDMHNSKRNHTSGEKYLNETVFSNERLLPFLTIDAEDKQFVAKNNINIAIEWNSIADMFS